jgi:hypothetical protein
MSSYARLEARITIPAGGWSGTIDDSGAGAAVGWTVAAGTYYMSELLAALHTALNVAAPTDTIHVQIGNGVGGTGRVTISGTGIFALVWTSANLRDLLGFSANLSGAASYLAPAHARALWLPDIPYNAPNELYPWGGWPETDLRSVESASGLCWIYVGQKKEATWIEWPAVRRARASKAHEQVVNESAQRFIEDGVWGFAPWAQPGGPIRIFPDADASAYVEYLVAGLKDFQPDQYVDGWAGGPWKVRLPRLVVQSTGDLVARDGPLSVYLADSVLEWIALGLAPPFLQVACTGAVNPLPPIIGAGSWGANGTGHLYQQTVAGWVSKFLGTVDGAAGQYWGSSDTTLNVAAAESYAVLCYLSLGGAALRDIYGHGVSGTGSNRWRLNANGTIMSYHAPTAGPGISPASANSYSDLATVRPYIWYRDCTADRFGTMTNLESLIATPYNELAQAGTWTRTIGAEWSGGQAPDSRCGLYAIWRGPMAELVSQRATIARLRWPLSW